MTNYDPNNSDDWLEKLILNGAVEVSGVDKNGELLYSFTEKLEQVDPRLYQKAIDSLYEDAKVLWMHGFVDMDVTLANPKISLNRKAFIKEEVDKLSSELQSTLAYIIAAYLAKD